MRCLTKSEQVPFRAGTIYLRHLVIFWISSFVARSNLMAVFLAFWLRSRMDVELANIFDEIVLKALPAVDDKASE